MMNKAVLGAFGTLLLLAGASVALADSNHWQGDKIVEQDRDTYARLDLTQKFGVAFQPHMAVCASAPAGQASCNARVVTDAQGTPLAFTTPDRSTGSAKTPAVPPGFGPSQFLSAYQLSGKAPGTTPKIIAVVDAYDDPTIASDLSTYDSTYKLPTFPTCSGSITTAKSACFQKVNQNGSITQHPASNAGWALEISLDVETAHALCQNCSILLVEANSATYNDLMSAEDRAVAMGASVVSNSYGGSEFSSETSYDSHFNHPGVAFVASAGDAGYSVEYPAASQYVTAVGGTSLFLNSNGTYNKEVAWSGTGSGCSAVEPKPTPQIGITPGCAGRVVADVSADADPNTGAAVYDSTSYYGMKGWFEVGGTSLASPIIAATYAQGGVPGGTQENSLPYAHPANLHDVTSGSNGSCGGSYLCTALAGYDGPTGLGSPNGDLAF